MFLANLFSSLMAWGGRHLCICVFPLVEVVWADGLWARTAHMFTQTYRVATESSVPLLILAGLGGSEAECWARARRACKELLDPTMRAYLYYYVCHAVKT